MKKILTSILLINTFVLQAQFNLKGTIKNYPHQRVVIKFNKSFDAVLINSVETDKNGSISIPIKEKYIGVIEISLLDAKKNISVISDNTDINFVASITDNNFTVENPGNGINKTYQDFLSYEARKKNVLPQLQTIVNYYSPSDSFYSSLNTEINKIQNLTNPDLVSYPFLVYYTNAANLINETENTENATNITKLVTDHFKNSGEEFESSGLGRALLFNYIKASALGAKTEDEYTNKIDEGLNNLLEEVGEDTNRGQDILAASISLFNSYGLTALGNKYLGRASSLTCEISPELKKVIDQNNNIREGKILPNFSFTHKINNKYTTLYDVKSKYKLVMVWASWCSHCREELPSTKLFYENFKKNGGEIIALSLDYDKNLWLDTIKGTTWINDSDLLYWDSKFAKELNITGTPTLFLLDENNKILKIGSKTSELNNLIK